MDKDWLFQLRKLRNVQRCGVLRVLSPESIAEHSFYVTAIAMSIAKKLEAEGVRVNYRKLVDRAMFHDVEEGITGDIPHPFKRSSEHIHRILEEEKDKIVQEFFPAWVTEANVCAKQGLEGEIVCMADFIELYFYCAEEQLLGNKDRYWIDIMATCRSVLAGKQFEWVSLQYFDMVDQYLEDGGLVDENRRVSNGTVV